MRRKQIAINFTEHSLHDGELNTSLAYGNYGEKNNLTRWLFFFSIYFFTSILRVDQQRNSQTKALMLLSNRGRLRSDTEETKKRPPACMCGLFTNKSDKKCRPCERISLSRRKISVMQFVRHFPGTFQEAEALNMLTLATAIGECHLIFR